MARMYWIRSVRLYRSWHAKMCTKSVVRHKNQKQNEMSAGTVARRLSKHASVCAKSFFELKQTTQQICNGHASRFKVT